MADRYKEELSLLLKILLFLQRGGTIHCIVTGEDTLDTNITNFYKPDGLNRLFPRLMQSYNL